MQAALGNKEIYKTVYRLKVFIFYLSAKSHFCLFKQFLVFRYLADYKNIINLTNMGR